MTRKAPRETFKTIARRWTGPKSVCECEHVGDGKFSQHEGNTYGPLVAEGHGRCLEPGCTCRRFTWTSWTGAFKRELQSASDADAGREQEHKERQEEAEQSYNARGPGDV